LNKYDWLKLETNKFEHWFKRVINRVSSKSKRPICNLCSQ